MNFKKHIAELKRRNVFRSAITYLVIAWLIAQVSSIVLPAFEAPNNFMKILIFILIIGFPISLVFAWVYELSPKGIKKIKMVEAEKLVEEPLKHQLNNDNKKLVVLPFENISTENDSNYFSDGLTEELSDDRITHHLKGIRNCQQAAQALIESAKLRGGRDNITVVIVSNELNQNNN